MEDLGNEGRPLKEGTSFGILAYLLGLGGTFLFHGIATLLGRSPPYVIRRLPEQEGSLSTFDVAGLAFYGSHPGVTIRYTGTSGRRPLSESIAIYADLLLLSPGYLVFYLVPLVALLGSGYLLLDAVSADSRRSAARAGSHLVAGYLPSVIVGLVVFSKSDTVRHGSKTTSFSVYPDPLSAVLLAGIVYPVVLGAIGGVLWFERR